MTNCKKNTNKIWDVIKNNLSIKFHSKSIYEQNYLKAKIREIFGYGTPREIMHYTCITCITIDSVMKIGKNNYQQVYLEERKYRVNKIQMPRFISTELDSDSELDSEAESKSHTELMDPEEL